MPPAGVDVFACTAAVRDVICSLESVHTSLVAQLFWVGFRRQLVPTIGCPSRRERMDAAPQAPLPHRQRLRLYRASRPASYGWSASSAYARRPGRSDRARRHAPPETITVPGYAATILILLPLREPQPVGLGIIGSYVWRAYETVKGRPGAIVRDVVEFRSACDE